MAKLLSPEEYAAKFGDGQRAAAPQADRGNLFGSAVDRAQAAALGIFEAYGDDVAGESRRRNQFEADETARRYYETNPDRIRSFREIRSLGDVGSYAADLGTQTAPALIGLGGAALVSGVPGALAMGTALGKGEILQAQREEAGQTDLMSATAGGLAYGLTDTLTGLGGAVVRRSLGTGIRGLDQAGIRALDDISGLKGVAARSAVAGGKSAAVEAAGETFQQGTVIGGRMAVNPDLEFFSPENVAELQESAVAGGLLGFGVGSFGGRRTRLERDEPVNLMGGTTTAPAPAARPTAPRAVSAEQINQMVGLGQPSRNAKTYTAEFEEAFSEPSGQFVQDPQTGIERELTMGEYYARMQGLDTAPAAGAPAATTAAPAAAGDPRRQILRDTYGIVPTKPALQLVDAIEAEGLALDSPVVAGVINFAAEKPLSSKRLEKAVEMLDKAIIESRKAPSVSTTTPVRPTAPVAPAQAAAPVVAVDGQAPAVNAPAVAAAPVAPVAQAVTPSGKASDVILNLVSGGIKDASADERKLTRRMVDKIVDDGLAAGNTNEQILDRVDRSTDGKLTGAAVVELDRYMNARREAPAPAAPAAEQTAPDILNLVFGEQDADIVRAALSGQSAQQIADDLAARGVTGRSRSMIANKIAGEKAVREQWPRKIAEAKQRYNLTDAQIEEALRAATAPDADTRSEVEREMGLGFARATIAAPMSETEAVEAGLENVVGTVGGSTSAVQGFTDLQKKVDAVLDQIEKTTDPQVLAALQARLAELAMEVKAVERREQARVRTEAGKETEIAADTEAELEAPVERAAPKKAEAAPEKAEGETKAKGKKKSKEEKEAEAEELSAEGKAARAAADAKLAAESAAKRAADRKGLVVGDTVMNPKLGTGVVKSFAGDGDATTVTVDFQSGQTKELSVKLAKLEKTDAVQKPSAAKVSVRDRAKAGQRDGAEDAKGTQAPAEGQARQKPTAEQVETRRADTLRKGQLVLAGKQWATYADTKTQGKWSDLTAEQQEKWRVAVVDNRNPSMALANEIAPAAEAAVPDAVTKRENTLLQGSLDKLPEAQVEKLEKHYGETRGTDQFMTKLRSDVVDYINKGAEAVAGAVRSIIKSISEGVLAVGIIFNPNVTMDQFAFDLPGAYAQTVAVRAEVPTAAAGKMSDLAKSVYERMAPVAKESGKAFIIADKPNGMIHAFNADGTVISQDSALYGKDMGDVMEGASSLEGGKKVTPAGTYSLKVTPRTEYAGGYSLDLKETYDGTGYIAVHAAYTGNKSEKRLERLKSTNVADKRISYGCINTSHEAFLNDFVPNIDKFNGGMAIVLPDNQSLAETMFEGTTKQVPTGTAKGQQTTKVAAKPEEDTRTTRFGKDTNVRKRTYSVKELTDEIKEFIRADIPGRKLRIVQNVDELINSNDPDVQAVGQAIKDQGAYGVAVNGVGYLVADRIERGQARAKFMHEVGAHLGLENLLTKADYDSLTQQIVNWAKKDDGSLESEIAVAAAKRVMDAGTVTEDRRSEMLAYFIEESMQRGIDPTAGELTRGPLTQWFRKLWSAFKTAARKLGVKPDSLTAVDVVNLAYGAARLEIAGTWHGTAADFRKFDHRFMGTGEGAQAFGWGTYLAQRAGIAKEYWSADVRRKTKGDVFRMADNTPITDTYFILALREAQDAGTKLTPEWLQNLESSNKELLEIYRAIGPAAARDANRLEYTLTEIGDARQAGGVKYIERQQPDGALMRVDTAVPEDEMLNWNTELRQQPQVLARIEAGLPQELRDAVEEEVNLDLAEMTGEDFYRALDFIERRDGQVSEQFDVEDYNKRLANKPAKQVVSTFIDEKLGVNGLKFLDAKSRAADRINNQIRVLERQIADIDSGQARRYNMEGEDFLASMKTTVARLKQELESQTRNIVIFNDKNIFRVGSAVGADRQRMKFGKNAMPTAPTTSTVEKNINKLLPPVARQPARNTLSTIERVGRKTLDYVVFTSDLINRASDAGIKSAKQFGDLLAARATKAREMERDVERIADLYTLVPEADRGTGPGSVNQFIFDSTREGKWGYDTATRKADPEMKVRFDNLSPESQNLVRAMFEYGDKTLARKKKTVLDTTASEYDALIAAAKATGDTAAEARLTNEKANTLKRFKSLFSIREGIPYAPIKRTGDHVVVAKSTEYIAAEEAGDTAKLEKLQANGDHYHVSFTDTAAQARNLRQQLEAQGAFNTVDDFEREGNMDALYGGESMLKALTAMRSKADAQVDGGDKSAAKLQSIISQLYLEALAEGSARKSEMKRRGVAGEVDMLSSFALQGRADANFLASLEYNSQVQDTLQKMRKERNVGGDRRRKSELFNELAKRYEGSLETPNNPWLDKLTRASSVYFLATSPAYYMQNLLQPFMMSIPAMAGRHDYTKAAAGLFKAYGELSDVVKSVKLGNQLQQQWDFSKVPADVREVIKTLADRGRIDIGLDTELGEFRIEGEGAFSARWNKVDKGLRTMVQKAEAINRLSTAMAAYRLELAKTKSPEAALDYADRILQETHGDYSRFNAPRAFNTPVGKVALQFRKFQLIQLTFYAKLINDAYTGKDRAMALKTLGYALSHTAVLAGAMGLPGYAAISWALSSILGSDDEEFDLTDELRKAIGDEDLANMILRGAPTVAGMDISGKVGAGTMLSILPFSNADLTTRSGQLEAAGAVFTGAAGGMIVRGLDGAQLMLSGDFYKGLELLMPKGISDAMKAYRIADEGMTRRNGDVILPPDEVDSLDAVWQALGIAPVKQTVVYEKRQRFQDMTSNFTDRTTRIKNNYVAAMRKGDTATAAEAREAWKKLQDAKVKNGLKRSPLSDLLKAPREQQKRERNTRDGIQFNRSTQRAAEEIAER